MLKTVKVMVMAACLCFATVAMASDGCYMCGSSSSDNIKQCKYHGSDDQKQRKTCKESGCKISGTTSCSSAANVKVIDPNG